MAYSVTGMTAEPDVGYKAERRMTPTGARELATAFLEEGRRHIEIRDDRGNTLSIADLEHDIADNSASERDVTALLLRP